MQSVSLMIVSEDVSAGTNSCTSRSNFEHVWSADAYGRRTSCQQFDSAGAAQSADHGSVHCISVFSRAMGLRLSGQS